MSPPPAKKAKPDGKGKKILVQTGQRGFLATCNYQEKGCIRECLNILAHYANFVYGADCEVPQPSEMDDIDELEANDISDDLQREVNGVQQQNFKPKKARFLALDTGAQNTVFIRTTLPDPVQLGYFIVRDIWNTKSQRTRSLIRLIPIELVCTVNGILNAVAPVIDKYFLNEPCTFCIVVNRRLNNSIDRDNIIRELANLVLSKNTENKVDLRTPQKTIVVEVIKGTCLIGVLPYYFKYKKYNLIECARPNIAPGKTYETLSAPEIPTHLSLPKKSTEESPESPVEGAVDEVFEESMTGPVEESAQIMELNDKSEYEKTKTDSPDSPHNDGNVVEATTETTAVNPQEAPEEEKEEVVGDGEEEKVEVDDEEIVDGEEEKVVGDGEEEIVADEEEEEKAVVDGEKEEVAGEEEEEELAGEGEEDVAVGEEEEEIVGEGEEQEVVGECEGEEEVEEDDEIEAEKEVENIPENLGNNLEDFNGNGDEDEPELIENGDNNKENNEESIDTDQEAGPLADADNKQKSDENISSAAELDVECQSNA